jgi:Na+/H+ antiporter NhaA
MHLCINKNWIENNVISMAFMSLDLEIIKELFENKNKIELN